MGNTQKGIGCLALILLIIVVAFIFTKNNPEAPWGEQAPGASSVTTDNSTEAPDGALQLPGLGSLSTEPSPTVPFSSTISTFSGIFRLNLSMEELLPLDDGLSEYGSSESSWAGSGTVGCALYQPVTIDRYNGEALVITGREWSGRTETQQNSMTLDLYPAVLLGYSNRSMMEDVDIEDIETISGISLAAVGKDPDALNDALSGTGIKLLHCVPHRETHSDDRFYILANRCDEILHYGFSEGTQYTDASVSMSNPCFVYEEDAPVTVPVQVTTDGYYTVDISSLAPGCYVIDGLTDNYAVIII